MEMGIKHPTFTVGNELRPCLVDDKRALWHKWTERREIIPPALLKGGHGGGEVASTFALVEYEDGTMAEVYPTRVRFLNTGNKMHELDIFFHTEAKRREGAME